MIISLQSSWLRPKMNHKPGQCLADRLLCHVNPAINVWYIPIIIDYSIIQHLHLQLVLSLFCPLVAIKGSFICVGFIFKSFSLLLSSSLPFSLLGVQLLTIKITKLMKYLTLYGHQWHTFSNLCLLCSIKAFSVCQNLWTSSMCTLCNIKTTSKKKQAT